MPQYNQINKNIVAKNFSKAAKNYSEFALIQKQAAQKLIDLTSPYINKNSQILDVGSGDSFLAKNLKEYKNIFEIDLSANMLNLWQERPSDIFAIQADMENLPFKNESFDVLFSSFSLQWSKDISKTLNNFYRVLKNNGTAAICIPENLSLQELKMASAESGCNFNFIKLPEFDNLRQILADCGFKEKEIFSEILKSEFDNGLKALHSIKKIGANYPSDEKNFISTKHLEKFNNFCLKNFHNKNKKFELSWKVYYLILNK